MDYIYDIVLNFQDKYYEFYEWLPEDKIINIKKIPIYKVRNKDYLNIKNNEVIIDRQTLPKKSKIFLITSGIEVMGIYINSSGKVIKKSSLIFEESDDILTTKDDIKLISIKYKITEKKTINNLSRIKIEKQKYVTKYLNKLDKIKDKYLLKYLYYDIYNYDEKNIDTIYNKLLELSQNNISKLYDSIKRINIEIKK